MTIIVKGKYEENTRKKKAKDLKNKYYIVRKYNKNTSEKI